MKTYRTLLLTTIVMTFALIVLGDDRVVEQTVISQAKYGSRA